MIANATTPPTTPPAIIPACDGGADVPPLVDTVAVFPAKVDSVMVVVFGEGEVPVFGEVEVTVAATDGLFGEAELTVAAAERVFPEVEVTVVVMA